LAREKSLKNIGLGIVSHYVGTPWIQLRAIVGECRPLLGFLESGGDIPYPSLRLPVVPHVGDQERVLHAIADLSLPVGMSAADDRQSVYLGACLSHRLLTRPLAILPDTRDRARRKKTDEEDAGQPDPTPARAALDALRAFSPQSTDHLAAPPSGFGHVRVVNH
jgi:hypothetical protein